MRLGWVWSAWAGLGLVLSGLSCGGGIGVVWFGHSLFVVSFAAVGFGMVRFVVVSLGTVGFGVIPARHEIILYKNRFLNENRVRICSCISRKYKNKNK